MISADGPNARAKARGRYWGTTAINLSVMSHSQANPIASNGQDFVSYTCENEMKFDALQPSRGTFHYGNADPIVAQAKANGMNMRCHALIWHSQVPAWIGCIRAWVIQCLEGESVCCYAWDVVNEALNEDGTYRTTDSVWYRTIGVDYIPLAFKAARAADPSAKLCYNDYNCDRPGRRATRAQNMFRMVRDAGALIDGMGLQGHMATGQIESLATLTENLRAFANLNVDVVYTELQATDWPTVVQACLAVARCVGITGWGFTDAHTCIGGGNPLIWDANYQKKPAYNAILTAAPPLYGQCGGQGYTGSTCCSWGTCRAQNQWYSQCL
ncbi:endo-1,4-beta-xylanase [Verticillium alfalfae VaMs.102]|uniref:Beta-xylanase n=1 Tax=Verticillium alfalfae (strain VaMs.102 / ATCC MYA-4576 / FGSC 10136) TaxID=526221 RepID=C9SCH5_VERA1|nr:endo-1,4-beta-xylanase [Verticillium alfalfae VaMs.102]EEY16790.1 endo-1,4-beta-xylanase [Verticillium alfalfae VaMs.102]